LLAFAMREFALSQRVGDDGTTQRDHCESYSRQTGEHYPGWEPIKCPPEALYLFNYWCSMSARRTNNGFGPNPIPDEGVLAWEKRKGIQLASLEHEVMDLLEQAYFRSQPKPKGK